ncbi:hypothetical protein PB2503_00375 [Parvularcula bermudensis HTCC2503]|uniref:DedA family protein n=1 Tax=Parvularcula bermudensis (strain ATCC BAA-594 / HTCC2503 / KCTC 12087) TaxID=314260 RepID=E0TII4_PARBH|nr:DedA family protein [Parvularcula bermudensis]ADM10842.1 hypothetical protein PB2503_00375 [Parvularcula bermudensis HTCC2503]
MFNWITAFIERSGYFGVALLIFTENVFPPIPSELIVPLEGFNAAQDQMSLILAILAGSVGLFAGAILWYYLGKRIGADRLKRRAAKHGRWFTMTPVEFDQACAWFSRHGDKAVMIGRLNSCRSHTDFCSSRHHEHVAAPLLSIYGHRNVRLDRVSHACRFLAGREL